MSKTSTSYGKSSSCAESKRILNIVGTSFEHGPNKSRTRFMQIGSKLETNLECSQFKSRARLKHYSSTRVRLVLKSKRYEARFLHCQNYPRATIETVLEHDRNKSRAPSKHFPSTVEANLEHDLSYSRAWSKQIASTVETNLEHDLSKSRALSKHIGSTVLRILEHGQNSFRARLKQSWSKFETNLESDKKYISSAVETSLSTIENNFQHVQNKYRAELKNTRFVSGTVKTIELAKVGQNNRVRFKTSLENK